MIDSPKGGFQFVKGSGPYSSGAVASPGFEVMHAIFNPLPGLWDAFGMIERHLEAAGAAARCAVRHGVAYPQSAVGGGLQRF